MDGVDDTPFCEARGRSAWPTRRDRVVEAGVAPEASPRCPVAEKVQALTSRLVQRSGGGMTQTKLLLMVA